MLSFGTVTPLVCGYLIITRWMMKTKLVLDPLRVVEKGRLVKCLGKLDEPIAHKVLKSFRRRSPGCLTVGHGRPGGVGDAGLRYWRWLV